MQRMPPNPTRLGGMPASVIAVDFGPTPTVTHSEFDSETGEWTFTVARNVRRPIRTPRPDDVPLAVRDALRTFAGEHTKIGPAA